MRSLMLTVLLIQGVRQSPEAASRSISYKQIMGELIMNYQDDWCTSCVAEDTIYAMLQEHRTEQQDHLGAA